MVYIRMLSALTGCRKTRSARAAENYLNDTESRPQNDEVFFRVWIVIVTNLLCWIPLCLCMFILWPKDKKPNKDCDNFEKLVNMYGDLSSATFCMVSFNSITKPYPYSMN